MKQMKYVLLVVMVLTLAVMSGCSPKNEKGADNGSAAAVTAENNAKAGSPESSSAAKKADTGCNGCSAGLGCPVAGVRGAPGH